MSVHFYVRAISLVLLSLGAPLVDAHHSRSAFSLDEQVTVSGRVTEVGWTNPHYYLSVRDTTNNKDWTFEGHSIPGLVRNGWSKTTFTVGDPVTVVANPNKKGDVLFGLLNSAETATGELYYSFRPKRSAVPPPIVPSTDFSGTWRLIRSLKANLLTAEGVPAAWSLNEKSKRLAQRYSPLDDPSLNCEPRGLPRMLEWPYAQQWRHTPEGIYIRIEHAVEERLLGREEVDNKPDVLGLGNSVIVSQSAEELVVRTTGFDAKHWGLNRGLDSSARKTLTERYQLVEGGLRLKLEYTVNDPEYLEAPAANVFYYAKVPDYDFASEPPCDVTAARRHLEFE